MDADEYRGGGEHAYHGVDSHGAKVWVSSAARDPAAPAAKGAQRTWPGVVWVASVAGAAVPVV